MKRQIYQYDVLLLEETSFTENTFRSTNLTHCIDIYLKAHTSTSVKVDNDSDFYKELVSKSVSSG